MSSVRMTLPHLARHKKAFNFNLSFTKASQEGLLSHLELACWFWCGQQFSMKIGLRPGLAGSTNAGRNRETFGSIWRQIWSISPADIT